MTVARLATTADAPAAMQFNVVVSTNAGAINTWEAYGFTRVGRLPLALDHPT